MNKVNGGGGRVGKNKTAFCGCGSQMGPLSAADQAQEAGVGCGMSAWPVGIQRNLWPGSKLTVHYIVQVFTVLAVLP